MTQSQSCCCDHHGKVATRPYMFKEEGAVEASKGFSRQSKITLTQNDDVFHSVAVTAISPLSCLALSINVTQPTVT